MLHFSLSGENFPHLRRATVPISGYAGILHLTSGFSFLAFFIFIPHAVRRGILPVTATTMPGDVPESPPPGTALMKCKISSDLQQPSENKKFPDQLLNSIAHTHYDFSRVSR